MEYNKAEYEQHSFENIKKRVVMCKNCNKPMEVEESEIKLSTGYPLVLYKCKECGTGMVPSGQGYHGNADDVKRRNKLRIKDL
jgi:RNase P subunit RPR2